MTDPSKEWARIRDAEEKRRVKISKLRQAIETEKDKGRKSAKTLLNIVLKSDGIKASSATQTMQIDPKIVENWIEILNQKGLIEKTGSKTDPILKPTDELKEKLLIYKEKKAKGDLKNAISKGIHELQEKKKEILKQHELRTQLEHVVLEKDNEIDKLHKDLEHEQDVKKALQDRLKALEKEQLGAEQSEIEKIKKQLELEHNERVKIEELLKQERDKQKTEQEKLLQEFNEKQTQLEKREKEIIAHEKNLEDDEELDILFGDEKDAELEQTELKLDEIKKHVQEDLEKIKQGENLSIEELQEILKEEAEVVAHLESETHKIEKEKSLDTLLEGFDENEEKTQTIKQSKIEEPKEENQKPKKTEITPQIEDQTKQKIENEEEKQTNPKSQKIQPQETEAEKPSEAQITEGDDMLRELEEIGVEDETPKDKEEQEEGKKQITQVKPASEEYQESEDASKQPSESELKINEFKPSDNPTITDLMLLMSIAGEVDFSKAVEKLKIKKETLNKWVEELCERNILVQEKKALRGLKIKVVDSLDLAQLKEMVEAEKIKEELRNLREQP